MYLAQAKKLVHEERGASVQAPRRDAKRLRQYRPMSIEEMLLGYTINGAKQFGIESFKGSIECGKDADFLVFDKDLTTAEQEGFSYNKPTDVYIEGKKMS